MYCETDYDRARALASQFDSVFTVKKENTWNIAEKTLLDSKLVISFDAATILKKLNGLNISRSPGPDLVNAKILRELAEPIVPVLSIIFKTYESCRLPLKWKKANISGIYKKGGKHDPENCCPISLTNVICKIMESLIKENLLEFLQKMNALSDRKFSFLPGRSSFTVTECFGQMD